MSSVFVNFGLVVGGNYIKLVKSLKKLVKFVAVLVGRPVVVSLKLVLRCFGIVWCT